MKNTTNDKTKKNSKKKQARRRRVRRFLTFVLLAAAVIVFARSSFFIVDDIKVTGNKKYSSDSIITQAGLTKGKNVFKMLGEKPKNLLLFRFTDKESSVYESMPYIKHISIRPSLPKAISIKVQERTPFCVLDANGTSILIDNEGYALEEVKSSGTNSKYFEITGAALDNYKLGQKVKFKDTDGLNNVMEFINELKKDDKDQQLKLYDKITSFNLSELNSIIVKFDNRITVKFGDLEDINYKIRYFRQLFVNNITANQKGTLDFSKSKNPYFRPDF